MRTRQSLHDAINAQKALINDTDSQAEALEAKAETLPNMKDRATLRHTASLIRAKLPALITALHELQNGITPPPPAGVYYLGTFSHEEDEAFTLPEESQTLWGVMSSQQIFAIGEDGAAEAIPDNKSYGTHKTYLSESAAEGMTTEQREAA